MAIIQVTPELLEGKANEVMQLKGQHEEVISKLTNLVHGLNEQWKGEAQDAFVSKYDSMQSQFKNLSEILEGYSKLMTDYAKDMRQLEGQKKGQISSFG